jgi:hypothetical protein
MGQPFTRTKKLGKLDANLWITSSDNAWGGGDPEYHVPDLEKLIKASTIFQCIPIRCMTRITIPLFGCPKI